MQSEPTEVPKTEPVDNLSPKSNSSAHHGLRNDHQPSTSPLRLREADADNPVSGGDNDTLSASSGGSGRGRQQDLGRLRSRDSSSNGGSPVNRIAEYERSHMISPRKGDAFAFQVIPSVKGGRDRISVDQFPNGESLPDHDTKF
jgi:hypothetical protein